MSAPATSDESVNRADAGGYNFPGDDAFHLQRIHVDNDMIRVKNRTSIDPRKLNVRRFEYQPRPDQERLIPESGKW